MEDFDSMSPAELTATESLDYFTWQEDIPKDFPRDVSFDGLPGDPVDRLFDSLPPITLDDTGVTSIGRNSDASALEYDQKFVSALWPFANSDVYKLESSDPILMQLWRIARRSFVLYEQKSNNTTRNVFMQALANLRDDLPAGSIGLDEYICGENGNAVVSNKVKWITYCAWIAAGRADHRSPNPDRVLTKEAMNINMTSHRNVCALCGARPFEEQPVRGSTPRIIKCGGCFVDELPNVTQQYCDETCSKKDWKDNHCYDCRQRRGFLRSAYLLRCMTDIFMKASYSGIYSERIQEYTGVTSAALKPDGLLDSTGPDRISSPDSSAEGPWTGGAVFPEKYIGQIDDSPAWAARLVQDAGDDYLRHLHGIIIDTIHAHCAQVVEMYVYVRNAGTMLHLGSDWQKETDRITSTTGKNPMFWPHPVLYCKLKPTGPKDKCKEWIIDLHCAKYGWTEYVLPFDAFVKTRMASSQSATAFKQAPLHWCPWEEKGRRRARYHLGHYIHNAIIGFIENKAKLKVPFEMTRVQCVKEWKALSKDYLDVFKTAAFEGAEKLRKSGTHRQFLCYQHNAYGAAYAVGVTNNLDEISFFKHVWSTPENYAKYQEEVEAAAADDKPEGSATRSNLSRWIARLRHRAEQHAKIMHMNPAFQSFDYYDLLGNMAKYFGIGGDLTLEQNRAILRAYFTREGKIGEAEMAEAIDNEIKKGVMRHKSAAASLLTEAIVAAAGTSGQAPAAEPKGPAPDGNAAEDTAAGGDGGAAQRAKRNKKKREKKKAKKAAAKAEDEDEGETQEE
ncbi:hypothetical protein ACHAQA_007027 [Verticillium albo-atrum]